MLDKVAQPFNVELPEAQGLDEMVKLIMKDIRKHSEDFREMEYYVGTNWLEVRDDEEFHEKILHIFNPEGEYIVSTDGNIECGEWRLLNGKLVFGPSSCDGEVYDLVFLDNDFFILQKHGNYRNRRRRYMVFVREPLALKLEWHEAMEYLFDKYRNSNGFLITVVVILVLIIALALLLS
jgi:hypothetical protein